MKTIALEEHFATDDYLKATGAYGKDTPPSLAAMQTNLLDLGEARIASMDAAGIDLQVLSLVAALGFDSLDTATQVSLAPDVNDELAAAVAAHPGRFQGFAVLPLKDPAAAARELERSVREHGFLGAMLDGTTDGKFLDDPSFLPIFEAAAALRVPVYLHPAPPPEPVMKSYFAGLPEPLAHLMSIAGWGWHAETGLHTLRLVCSGLFDRLPDLQLVIGHMGEGLPYALARSSAVLSGPARLRQPVADYFKSNLWITTSGYFTLPPLACAREVIGLDRIMFSVDYPFSPNEKGRTFLDLAAPTMTPAEFEAFTHTTATKVLKLK